MGEAGFGRRAVLAGMAALPLAACAPGLAGGAKGRLRAATFNIWHDAGGNWPVRLGLLADHFGAAAKPYPALSGRSTGLPKPAQAIESRQRRLDGMSDIDSEAKRLRQERDEAEHDKAIMQRLLNRAASEIEDLADADCEEETKDRALDAARRFRRAGQF